MSSNNSPPVTLGEWYLLSGLTVVLDCTRFQYTIIHRDSNNLMLLDIWNYVVQSMFWKPGAAVEEECD